MRLIALMTVSVIACAVVGCNKSETPTAEAPANPGAVAVIDLDEVARQLGRDIEMANSIKAAQKTLNERLAEVQIKYRDEFTKKKDELGEEPAEEELQSLQAFGQQANLQFNQVVQTAKNNLNKHRIGLISDFRKDAKPIAQEVAKEKGLNIIITKNDSVVFSYETAVDITDEVVAQMREKGYAAPPAARTAQQPGTTEKR